MNIESDIRKWQQPLQKRKKKKGRTKRYETNEVKKKQMTLFAAGMSHDGEGGGGGTSGVEISTRPPDHNIGEFFIKMQHIY